MLTDAQRAAYDRDGFIVVPDVFSAEDVAELRRVTDEFVSASATVTANDLLLASEPEVRWRLSAGGREIRTLGPPSAKDLG
jgi:hypothetical protein